MSLIRAVASAACAAVALFFSLPAAAQTAVVSFSTNAKSVSESAGSVTFHLLRTADTTGVSNVFFQTTSGSAGSSDFSSVFTSVSFAAGETTKDIVVTIANDAIYEGDETFSGSIFATGGTTVGSPAAEVVTILDDDAAALVGFGLTSYNVSESAGVVNLTVVRSGVTNVTTTVNWATANGFSATAGTDYLSLSGTLTFAPGETLKTIAVSIVNDGLPEGAEVFAVNLGGVVNGGIAAGQATVTINDDDPSATLSYLAPKFFVNEADGVATVTVIRGGNTAISVTVQYSTSSSFCCFSGSADNTDFVPVSGTLSFAPGELSKSYTIPIFDDLAAEGDEEFVVTLSNPVNATFPQGSSSSYEARVRIDDNDDATQVAVSPASYTAPEAGGVVNVTMVRSGVTTGTTTVSFATASGTAGASDYVTASGTVTFQPGQTSILVPVTIVDDNLAEGNETFTFGISAIGALVTTPTATITIVDDEQVPLIGFASGAATVVENAGSIDLQVTRSGPLTQTASVNYRFVCCPTPSGRYSMPAGTLVFGIGEQTKTITVTINNDTIAQPDETFGVELYAPTNGVLGRSSTYVTLVDDDEATTYQFSQSLYEVGEGAGNVVVTLLRRGNISATSAVSYSTAGSCCGASATAGVDYLPTSSTLSFAPGETSKQITIPILQDADAESDETFLVQLNTVNVSTTVRIHDDDPLPRVSAADVVVTEGDSGPTPATVTLQLSTPLSYSLVIRYGTVDGSAKSATDYAVAIGSVTFAPGQTAKNISLSINGDRTDEGDETFTLALQRDVGCCSAVQLQPNATITIRNDDASFSVADATVNEGDGGSAHAKFVVRLSVPRSSPASVAYTTLAGTAQFDSDFTGVSGSLTFAPGETVKEVIVPVIGDRVPEPNESFFLRLADATGAPISRAQAKGTIVNDDAFFTEYDGLEYAGAGKHALALDLYVPAIESTTPFPLVVWIHGDHWSDGSRASTPAIREANRGYAVASIDYRSSDAAAFPAQIDDAKAAIRWLRANAARFHLDPDRVAVWGFGSGGHLAALLGTSGGVAELEDLSEGNAAFSSRVQLVIDWAGPIDLLQMQADALPCSTANHDSSGSYESLLIGCAVQQCPARAASASPSSYVTQDDAAFLLMHGRADCEVSPAQSESFARQLRAKQLETTLKLFDNAGHAGGFWDSEEALGAVDAFLDIHFKTPPRRRSAEH